MARCYKNIHFTVLVILIFVTIFVATKPVPDRSKIRIHVPVKHHTHYHTVIKHIPVKHEIKEIHKPYKYHHPHHHSIADVDDDDDEDIVWPRKPYTKRKKFRHPFIKK